MKNLFILALSWLLLSHCVLADEGAPEGWKAESPREEIRPSSLGIRQVDRTRIRWSSVPTVAKD